MVVSPSYESSVELKPILAVFDLTVGDFRAPTDAHGKYESYRSIGNHETAPEITKRVNDT
jgi:hypothetical protein